MSWNQRINRLLRQQAQSRNNRSVLISLDDFRLCDANGDVPNTAAIGGLLSSNTAPILEGAAGLIVNQINWATTVVIPVRFTKTLPADFDGSQDAVLRLLVASGTTDAASFAVTSSWDGGATVTDAFNDAATKSATFHWITCTVAAGDIPDAARSVTLILTPPAHATNAILLRAAELTYTPIAA